MNIREIEVEDLKRKKAWRWLAILTMVSILFLSGCISSKDSDKDGYPDEEDHFPDDPNEWLDSDNDGVGDNADDFPHNSKETADTDGDGYGDNSDDFPDDPNEWYDSDGDGHGDNSDVFPEDWEEWADSDGDGYGDNSDDFPNDADYHLICPECNGTGKVPETEELNYTASGKLADLGYTSPEWHVYVTITNLDKTAGVFEVEIWVVEGGEELWSGEAEHSIGPGETYQFDISTGGLSPSVSQNNLKFKVSPPSWVVGPEITCPECGGTGKI